MKRTVILVGAFILFALLMTGVVRYIILGGASPKDISSDALTEQIDEEVRSSAGEGNIDPQLSVGKDYIIDDVHYFEDRQWIVATLKPVNESINQGMIVMKREGNSYVTAVGPGSNFPRDTLNHVPTSVLRYLDSIGMVSDIGDADYE